MLRSLGVVGVAPWSGPYDEVWKKNLIWGCDWTERLVGCGAGGAIGLR